MKKLTINLCGLLTNVVLMREQSPKEHGRKRDVY